uniref:Putative rRNA methyltransferase n=2 Tax=Aceria tosichella TaxID=561515 RepID=A0A6G1SIN9_9ACAR
MGKKGKVGKQRKDNYYKLAKQKGFRSRAAFKLIQLNRKFQFLENSRVCIDLCAAPGGWLQVASEYMPVSSVIIGVDLAPITPIRNVITFQSDITTIECSKTIEGKLQGWSADIVLHDGAPNVGKNWLHDSYNQNVLVINALKIACTHLTRGGWFITKIFRSADYNSLIWVFGKLFGKVHATKPQASRSESAEIFVVCQNYKKPDEIDPSFFDPTKLFADISEFDEDLKKRKADLLKPPSKIKKTRAHGYEDGDVFKTVTDLEFVASQNHMDYLAQCHELKLTNSDIIQHESTTEEIKECCKDLRVLGRKDLLKLLKWRRVLRKDLIAKLMQSMKVGTLTEDGEPCEDGDNLDSLTIRSDDDDIETVPELQLDDIEALEDEEKKKEAKRLKRKEEKRIKDYQQRVTYGMVNDGDVLIEEENDLFNLKKIAGKSQLDKLEDAEPDETVETFKDPSDEPNESLKQRKGVTFAREADCQYFERDEDYESDQEAHPSDDVVPEKTHEPKIKAPKKILKDSKNSQDILERLGASSNAGGGLLTDLEDVSQSKISAAKKFFDRNSFTEIDLEDALESDLVDKIAANRTNSDSGRSESNKRKLSDIDLSRFDDGIGSDDEDDLSDNDNSSDSDSQDESKPKKKQIKLGPEGLALASMMVSSEKMRRDIEDEGWNRYAHADSHLAPKWFREEEEKYCRRNIPVRPELVKEYKQKLRDIDAKPIKKELEAKARKKRRAMRKMQRVRKKVEGITTNEDLTQKEQISQIKNVYKTATKTKKKEIKVVVARKGLPAKKPAKGKYKMVDARMRKDLRGKQRRDGKGKPGKKGAAGSGGAKNKRKKREGNNSMGPPKSRGPARKVRSTKGGAGGSKSRAKRR